MEDMEDEADDAGETAEEPADMMCDKMKEMHGKCMSETGHLGQHPVMTGK